MKLIRLLASFVLLAVALRAASVDSKITAVTVYADRAVVTRTASVRLPAGQTEVVLTQLPDALWDQSLQVSARGTATATIVDVSARRAFAEISTNTRVQELEEQLRALRADDRRFVDRAALLETQRQAITQFINGAMTPGGKEGDRPKLVDVRAALEFGEQQLGELASAVQKLEQQREELARKIQAVENQLNELRGGRGRAFKNVTVRFNAEQAGELELTVAYTVGGARWAPSYDVRAASGERQVSIAYFGVVRQTTGEDWKDVALTLSTARPALGGAAPELGVWELSQVDVVRLQQFEMREQAARNRMEKAKALAAPAAMAMAEGAPEMRDATVAQASVDSGATSASFKITTAVSIPSDNSAQKVPITGTRLAAAPEYATTPKLQQTAFLTTKVVNDTEFPLFAGAMNVFLDGTFVATSQLKTVMPGEKFDLALGADEGISVKHKRVQRFTENTGLTNSGRRITYEYLLTIQNNKRTAERIVVSDQIPVSRHEKIVVKQLAPSEREQKPDAEGKLKWTLDLKPGEKRELTVKFSIDYPGDMDVSGLE